MTATVFEDENLRLVEEIAGHLSAEGMSPEIVNEYEASGLYKLKVSLLEEFRAFEIIDKFLNDNFQTKTHALVCAKNEQADLIWKILQHGIRLRAESGSDQWQDGYPNPEVVADDIAKNQAFLLLENGVAVAYAALVPAPDPNYEYIFGEWLSDGNYIAVHRLAVAEGQQGRGLAGIFLNMAEGYALENQFKSIRLDTNFDNLAMLKTAEKLGYKFCGKVMQRSGERLAFEKLLLADSDFLG
ncbi:GNAT family N-acetyltransferase [Cruoricaptor ignavus]|uniref:GNAT family N-acetyltransferase n=1 Tax=Cruoricaptor ignavus TaxID=1118202 RepID=UPI00370D8481